LTTPATMQKVLIPWVRGFVSIHSWWFLPLGYALLGFVLIVLPERDFLFGSGYLLYHNWPWPVGTHLAPQVQGVYSPTPWAPIGPDPAGYTRSIFDWPAILIGGLLPSTIDAEKAFVLYVFLIAFLLAFAAGTLFARLYGFRRRTVQSEATRALFITLIFVNPASLQWEAGMLVPFFWGVPLLSAIILATLLGVQGRGLRYFAIAGLLLGVSATLDPRLYIGGFASIVVIGLGALTFRRNRLATLRRFGILVGVSLPLAIWTYISYALAGAGFGGTARGASYASIAGLSTNSQPFNVFSLLGYYISEITYSSPSVLWNRGGIGSLPTVGNPPFALALTDPASMLWILALAAIPIVAFSSLLPTRSRRTALPFGLIAIGSIIVAVGSTLPVACCVGLEVGLGNLPTVGSIFQTTFGVPSFAQVLTAAVYVPMLLITIIEIERVVRHWRQAQPSAIHLQLTRNTAIQITHSGGATSRQARRFSLVVSVFVVAIVLFASWQFFDGSYYPGGLSPGANPNSVPSIGSSSPVSVPASDKVAWDFLSNLPNQTVVYWPGASGFTYPWSNRSTPSLSLDSPQPTAEPAGLSELIAGNLTSDTLPLLEAYGIQYVILDNMSSIEVNREFGVSNLLSVVDFFEDSPGIEPIWSSPPNTWVFGVVPPSPNSLSVNELGLDYNGSLSNAGVLLGGLSELGFEPVLDQWGLPVAPNTVAFLGADSRLSSNTILIGTSGNLSQLSPSNRIIGFTPATRGSFELALTGTGEVGLPAPDANWTVAVWSLPSGEINATSNSTGALMLTHTGLPASVSLNYLSALVTGSTRGIPVSPRAQVTFNVSVDAESPTGSTSTITLNVVASNSSGANLEQLSTNSLALTKSVTEYRFSGILPVNTSLFTLRAFVSTSGTVSISNVSIAYSELQSSPGTFSGRVFAINSGSTRIASDPEGVSGELWIDVEGSGWVRASSEGFAQRTDISGSVPEWVEIARLDVHDGLTISFNGTLGVAGLAWVPTAVVNSTRPCLLSQLQSTDEPSFAADVDSSAGCLLVLHEQYSSRWQATLSNNQVLPPYESLLGQSTFLVPAGDYQVHVGLNGQEVLKVVGYIVAFATAVSLISTGIYLAHVEPCHIRLPTFLRRMLRQNKSSTKEAASRSTTSGGWSEETSQATAKEDWSEGSPP